MDTIDKLQMCINIQEGIKTFTNLRNFQKDNILQLNGNFPDLKDKYIHNIDIYNKCIERLEKRYNNIIKTLTHEKDNTSNI